MASRKPDQSPLTCAATVPRTGSQLGGRGRRSAWRAALPDQVDRRYSSRRGRFRGHPQTAVRSCHRLRQPAAHLEPPARRPGASRAGALVSLLTKLIAQDELFAAQNGNPQASWPSGWTNPVIWGYVRRTPAARADSSDLLIRREEGRRAVLCAGRALSGVQGCASIVRSFVGLLVVSPCLSSASLLAMAALSADARAASPVRSPAPSHGDLDDSAPALDDRDDAQSTVSSPTLSMAMAPMTAALGFEQSECVGSTSRFH